MFHGMICIAALDFMVHPLAWYPPTAPGRAVRGTFARPAAFLQRRSRAQPEAFVWRVRRRVSCVARARTAALQSRRAPTAQVRGYCSPGRETSDAGCATSVILRHAGRGARAWLSLLSRQRDDAAVAEAHERKKQQSRWR